MHNPSLMRSRDARSRCQPSIYEDGTSAGRPNVSSRWQVRVGQRYAWLFGSYGPQYSKMGALGAVSPLLTPRVTAVGVCVSSYGVASAGTCAWREGVASAGSCVSREEAA